METTKRRPLWTARVIACWVAIAAVVPYLTLKAIWLSGLPVGFADPSEATDARHNVGNIGTAGLALVAIVLAVAFTYSWGRRVPVWLWLAPIWVGTGLLAPIAFGLPVGVLAAVATGTSAMPADSGGDAWMFALVYGGFTLQAVGLLGAFVLHVAARWPELFRMRTGELPRSEAYQVLKPLANAAAVVALGFAASRFLWAVGGTWALTNAPAANETVAQRVHFAVEGLLMVAGVVGLLALVYRWGSGRLLVPLIAAWTGIGTVFGQSLIVGAEGGDVDAGGVLVVHYGGLAGTVLGVVAMIVLCGRHRNA